MKKIISTLCFFCLACVMLSSCGSKTQTPEAIAQQWCDLNGKVFKAAEGTDKEKAKEERKKYETEIEDKYSKDKDMMDKIKKAVEACEDKSEGRS